MTLQTHNASQPSPQGDAGASPAPEMRAVLDQLAAMGAKPLHSLTVEAARAQATPADAVAVLMQAHHIPTGPAAHIAARDITIPGPAGEILARIYTPLGAGPFPVVVYYHGGGWVIADIDTYDATARALSLGANAVVLSAHYRQAPENIFPAAHVDAYAVYFWALGQMADLNGITGQIAFLVKVRGPILRPTWPSWRGMRGSCSPCINFWSIPSQAMT